MMFSSLDDNVVGYSDIIFGDNSRGKVQGIGTIATQVIILFQKFC